MIKTPSYVYDLAILENRINRIKSVMPNIPLTFSIKANSFILKYIESMVSHVEVCSPGELDICKSLNIAPNKIIYSGVMKEEHDITEAIKYGVDILTAESIRHATIINRVAKNNGVTAKVILRITSGNQFGMDTEDICNIINSRVEYENIEFFGFHFYSGTQKKKITQIEKDLERIASIVELCKSKYNFKPKLVEYGPGLAVEYFKENADEIDERLLNEVSSVISDFSKRYTLGIEMGRFIASSCGKYYTCVKDIKSNNGVNYVIVDGGIHHLKYYGQMMALNSPRVFCVKKTESENESYCLCGSLCTVADVLVKDIKLPKLDIGDVLEFHRCGAYSITEASQLFLSRNMPYVYIRECDDNVVMIRSEIKTSGINMESL